MKAGPIEIGLLLQNRLDLRFCVPIYQRHYVWTLRNSGSRSGMTSVQKRSNAWQGASVGFLISWVPWC